MFSCEHADKSNIGPTGPGTVSGTVPQLAYFSGTEGDASDVLVGTPNAIAGAGNTTTGVTNQILFSDGSNVAPVLSFQDDKNTGLYRIGTDNIGIATNSIKAVDIAVTETEVTGTNSVTGINDVLKVNFLKSGALVTNDGPGIQFEMEGRFAAKKGLNQIHCICTDVSPWGSGTGAGPVCSTAFTDTITNAATSLQTHTERLRIQPGKDEPHVVVDGNLTQGWSNAQLIPSRMIHYSDKDMIYQFSAINDTASLALQPGIAIANNMNQVTSTSEAEAKNEGWLITPPHIASPQETNSIRCFSTYGIIGDTVLGKGLYTIDNIYVPGASSIIQTPCHGTQLTLTKVNKTQNELIIRDNTVSSNGNIFIGISSPWSLMFSAGQYKIGANESATISFIWNTAIDPIGGVGSGWHCTGFHSNIG